MEAEKEKIIANKEMAEAEKDKLLKEKERKLAQIKKEHEAKEILSSKIQVSIMYKIRVPLAEIDVIIEQQ